jgi:hypothetical protein
MVPPWPGGLFRKSDTVKRFCFAGTGQGRGVDDGFCGSWTGTTFAFSASDQDVIIFFKVWFGESPERLSHDARSVPQALFMALKGRSHSMRHCKIVLHHYPSEADARFG